MFRKTREDYIRQAVACDWCLQEKWHYCIKVQGPQGSPILDNNGAEQYLFHQVHETRAASAREVGVDTNVDLERLAQGLLDQVTKRRT